jgi:hypothetical protein
VFSSFSQEQDPIFSGEEQIIEGGKRGKLQKYSVNH